MSSVKQSMKTSLTDSGFNLRYSRLNTEPEEENIKILDTMKSEKISAKKIFKNRNSQGRNQIKKFKSQKNGSTSFLDFAASPRLSKRTHYNFSSEKKTNLINKYTKKSSLRTSLTKSRMISDIKNSKLRVHTEESTFPKDKKRYSLSFKNNLINDVQLKKDRELFRSKLKPDADHIQEEDVSLNLVNPI
jgi:hypothetical protein